MRHAMTALIVRRPPVESLDGIGRHWYHGNAVWTHAAHRAFVAATELELFVVRVYKRALAEGVVVDPGMRATLVEFMRQESTHARYHRMVYDMLRRQGYEIDSVVRRQRARLEALTRSAPLPMLLSMVAAAEHHFASVGAWLLRNVDSLVLPREIRDILVWHAAEEIEHQSVAHDVFVACCRPSQRLRWQGYRALARLFRGLVVEVFHHLVAQEPGLTRRRVRREMGRLLVTHAGMLVVQAGNALRYLRPGFHPLDRGYARLAEAHFAQHVYAVV